MTSEREAYAAVGAATAWKFICEEVEVLYEDDPDETQFADPQLARWICIRV